MSNNNGQLIVISAPSGTGKTSVIKNVIKKIKQWEQKVKILRFSHNKIA